MGNETSRQVWTPSGSIAASDANGLDKLLQPMPICCASCQGLRQMLENVTAKLAEMEAKRTRYVVVVTKDAAETSSSA